MSIRAVEEAALQWVWTHRGRFALGEDALTAEGQVNRTWKPLGELARVCASVSACTGPSDPVHTRARELLDFAWRQTREGELFPLMQSLEPFATYPLEVYAAFASAGFRHPGYEASAAVVARTRGWRLTEQYPTRRLGILEAERRSGIRPHGPVPQALDRTWLGGLPEPWTFERAAGYALTHVVFHLTAWGREPHGMPPDLASYLLHWLPPWLDTCLEARMWDLGCELLAVAASLPRRPDSAVLDDAWSRIADAQHTSGALPEEGVVQDAADAEETAGETAEEAAEETAEGTAEETPGPDPYDFTDCYHSTLMAAFAASLTTADPPAGPGDAHRTERPAGQGVPG